MLQPVGRASLPLLESPSSATAVSWMSMVSANSSSLSSTMVMVRGLKISFSAKMSWLAERVTSVVVVVVPETVAVTSSLKPSAGVTVPSRERT